MASVRQVSRSAMSKVVQTATFYKHKNDLICPRVISMRLSVCAVPLHMDFRFQFEFLTSQFTAHGVINEKKSVNQSASQ